MMQQWLNESPKCVRTFRRSPGELTLEIHPLRTRSSGFRVPDSTCNSTDADFQIVEGRITDFGGSSTEVDCGEGVVDEYPSPISLAFSEMEPTINVSGDITTLTSPRGSQIHTFVGFPNSSACP